MERWLPAQVPLEVAKMDWTNWKGTAAAKSWIRAKANSAEGDGEVAAEGDGSRVAGSSSGALATAPRSTGPTWRSAVAFEERDPARSTLYEGAALLPEVADIRPHPHRARRATRLFSPFGES
jgi:hypothetical protein